MISWVVLESRAFIDGDLLSLSETPALTVSIPTAEQPFSRVPWTNYRTTSLGPRHL